MITTRITIILLALALLTGCSSQRPLTGVGMFDFTYDGQDYGILSSATSTNGSGNMLVQKTDNHISMRAMDFDKDGSIDKVIVGTMTVLDADKIYKAGISKAQNQNKFMEFEHERMFSAEGPGYFKTYIIQTFMTTGKGTYNKFIILDQRTQLRTVLVDNGADGVLDQENKDNDYQKLYSLILEKGMQDGKIDHNKRSGQYIVEKRKPRALVTL